MSCTACRGPNPPHLASCPRCAGQANGQTAQVASGCCSGYMDAQATCRCVPNFVDSASAAQCCSGSINIQGSCTCVPNGSPAIADDVCCSKYRVNGVCR